MNYIKKKMIITTPAVRELYEKHLNKMYDHAEHGIEDGTCYLCPAAKKISRHTHPEGYCKSCPLPCSISTCDTTARRINLRHNKTGAATRTYGESTNKSIIKHARWIEKWIVKNTDCEFVWKE